MEQTKEEKIMKFMQNAIAALNDYCVIVLNRNPGHLVMGIMHTAADGQSDARITVASNRHPDLSLEQSLEYQAEIFSRLRDIAEGQERR